MAKMLLSLATRYGYLVTKNVPYILSLSTQQPRVSAQASTWLLVACITHDFQQRRNYVFQHKVASVCCLPLKQWIFTEHVQLEAPWYTSHVPCPFRPRMTCPFIVENSLFKHHKGDIPSGSSTEEKKRHTSCKIISSQMHSLRSRSKYRTKCFKVGSYQHPKLNIYAFSCHS